MDLICLCATERCSTKVYSLLIFTLVYSMYCCSLPLHISFTMWQTVLHLGENSVEQSSGSSTDCACDIYCPVSTNACQQEFWMAQAFEKAV